MQPGQTAAAAAPDTLQPAGPKNDFRDLTINERHVVKAVPDRVFSMAIHPTCEKPLVLAGSKWGHVGIWSPRDMGTDEVCYCIPYHRLAVLS